MDIKTYSTHYSIDGNRYDRVTEIFNYFMPKYLVKWALDKGKKAYQDETKIAKSIGTRVDKISTAIVNNERWKITEYDHPAVRNCVSGFKNWLNEEKPIIVDTQVTCKDDELKIAGTRDMRTADTIIDIKCANRISIQYWLQLSAYHYLSKLPEITHIAILRLDKLTGDYQYKRIPIKPELWELYKSLLGYYRYCNIADKIAEKGGEDGIEVVATEFQKKFGIFATEVQTDWSKFHSEI